MTLSSGTRAVIEEAKALKSLPVDVVEWRVDWFEHVFDTDRLLDALKALRAELGELPILVTFRTSKEGGEKAIDAEAYADLNIRVAKSGLADLVDVEVFTGDEIVRRIIQEAHAAGVKVVASNHDFDKTPDKDDIVSRLRKMKGFGLADTFYDGVEVNESWEQDFRPIALQREETITPVQLIMVLDLYFRLTPNTMVTETPEVRELGKMIGLSADTIVEAMEIYQICDPYLNRTELLTSELVLPCQDVWQRYGADHPEKLSALAAQLKEYFI